MSPNTLHSPIAEPAASHSGRLGGDARSSVPCHVAAGRASKSYEQSDDWLASCVRRMQDDTTGFGFAGPGEMERRAAEEAEAAEPLPVVAALVLLAALGLLALAVTVAIAATLAGRG